MLADRAPLPDPGEIVRRSSGEQAARYVRRLIFDGRLEPGARVPQDEIAGALGISRIPLREALIALEREGWVTLEMHRGAFVTALGEQTVRDHYAILGLIYGYTVEQAIARSGPELVERVVPIERAFRATSDRHAAARLLLDFHAAVIDTAKSNRIRSVLRTMSTIVPGNEVFDLVPGAFAVEQRAIPRITRAIRRGDGEQAAVEYRQMMSGFADEVVEVLRERGLFEPAPD